MKPYFFILLFIATSSLTLPGCSEESLAVDEPVNLEWTEIANTAIFRANTRKRFFVFEHQQGLDNMLLGLTRPRSAPQVDFSKYKVVMLGIGGRGEGVGLSISSVEEFERYTQVNINFNHPGEHCIGTLIGYPPRLIFYKIKTRKEIIISEHLNLAHCEPRPR